jgi:hypothetical protein
MMLFSWHNDSPLGMGCSQLPLPLTSDMSVREENHLAAAGRMYELSSSATEVEFLVCLVTLCYSSRLCQNEQP